MFNQPRSSSGFFKPRDHVGHLILITEVKEKRARFDDLRKATVDEFVVDLADVTENGDLVENVVVSHVGITNKLVPGMTNVLGRIGTVPSDKGNDAFVLNPFDEEGDDVALATAWVKAHEAGAFSQPKAAEPAEEEPKAPTTEAEAVAALEALLAKRKA